jgi:hypothetical protein
MTDIKEKALALPDRLRLIPDRNGLMYDEYDDVMEAADLIDALKIAREALRNIQIEAEREQGSWVHLKRVIALNCKQTLAALEQSK